MLCRESDGRRSGGPGRAPATQSASWWASPGYATGTLSDAAARRLVRESDVRWHRAGPGNATSSQPRPRRHSHPAGARPGGSRGLHGAQSFQRRLQRGYSRSGDGHPRPSPDRESMLLGSRRSLKTQKQTALPAPHACPGRPRRQGTAAFPTLQLGSLQGPFSHVCGSRRPRLPRIEVYGCDK